MESGELHAVLRFRIFHERIPNKAGTKIFGHEHADSRIDGDDFSVIPVFERIKRILKRVPLPEPFAIAAAHGVKHEERLAREEWQRTGGGARNERAVNRADRRRATPPGVAVHGIRSGDAPRIVGKIGKPRMQVDTEEAVRLRRENGIFEVVGVMVALAAKVEPGMRILVNEERCIRADIAQSFVVEDRTPPGVPGSRGNGVSAGTNAEQINQHEFAIGVPAVRQKTVLGSPAVGNGAAAVEHPEPVHPVEDLSR